MYCPSYYEHQEHIISCFFSSFSWSRSRAKQASQADQPAIPEDKTTTEPSQSSENSETGSQQDRVQTEAVDAVAQKMRVIIKPKLMLRKRRTRGESQEGGANS